MPVSADRYVNEYFAAPSPDGRARGIHRPRASRRASGGGRATATSTSPRSGCSTTAPTSPTRAVTEGGAKQMWPMWAADGRTLFYVSDRSGAAEHLDDRSRASRRSRSRVHRRARAVAVDLADGRRDRLRARLRHLAARHGVRPGGSRARSRRRGAPAGPAVEHLSLTNQIQELALSPDGKKVAFVVRGEVFAASAKDGGDAARVTSTAGERVAGGVGARRPAARLRVGPRRREPPLPLRLPDDARDAADARPARRRAAGVLARRQVARLRTRPARTARRSTSSRRQERVVAKGYLSDRLAGGPPGRLVARRAVDRLPRDRRQGLHERVGRARGRRRSAAGLRSSPTRSPAGVSWSPDGTFLLFDTSQRTEDGQMARVDLTLRVPKFREDQFRDLFQDETPRPAAPAAGRSDPTPARGPSAARPDATRRRRTPPRSPPSRSRSSSSRFGGG